ncbi:MAG: VWA domain-containing protein [Verrucomicrobiota bacterium]
MKTLPLLCILLAGAGLLNAAPEPLTLRVVPERDVIYTGGSREVIVQIEIEGRRPDRLQRAPMNLALVLDRSGSMAGAKLEKARQAACVALDQLDANDYFSLVTYDNEADVLIPPQRIGSSRERDALKERIDRIRPGGGTAIYAGVKLGAEQLRRHQDRERVNRVILLSDGLANSGPSRTSDLAGLGLKLREEGFSVSTIGVGDDYNEDLMTALAEASHANYYYVKDAEKLPGIFSDELGAARTVLARSIQIRITVPEGVRIREILGHPEIQCGNHSAEIVLPEYFGSDKRRFLARCVVENPPAESLEVASVALRYEEAGSGRIASQNHATTVRFTNEQGKSDESQRVEVARDLSIHWNSEAKKRAVKLADEGKAKEAAEVLRSQAAANAAVPAPAQIPNMAEENRRLAESASEVDSQGSLSKSRRKAVQWENYQDKYQKR